MLVSFRAGGWRRNIPGFNRGNVDWFPGLRAQEKNPLSGDESFGDILKEVLGGLTPAVQGTRDIPAS
jgi:hypothetical protein